MITWLSSRYLTVHNLFIALSTTYSMDIGELIFVEFLKMYSYPGSPFSGNIVNDLVMYFFIPTVILIVFIKTILNRMPLLGSHKGLQYLVAISLYLFIAIRGFFNIFAQGIWIYFLLLIIAGFFWFIGGHFSRFNPQGDKPYQNPYTPAGKYPYTSDKGEIAKMKHKIQLLNKQIAERLQTLQRPDVPTHRAGEIQKQIGEFETERNELELAIQSYSMRFRIEEAWERNKPR